MTSRRGFLSAIFAGAAAPAVVKASSLMKLVPTESGILTYKSYELGFDIALENADSTLLLRPTKLLLPATMMQEALKILNKEFDRAYMTYMEQL